MFRVIILLIIPLFIRPCFQRTFYYMLLQDLLQLFGIKVVLKDMHSTNALGRKTTPCIQFLWMRYLWSDVFRIKCFTDWPLYMYSSRATVQLDDSFVREQDTLPVWLDSVQSTQWRRWSVSEVGSHSSKYFDFAISQTTKCIRAVWNKCEEWLKSEWRVFIFLREDPVAYANRFFLWASVNGYDFRAMRPKYRSHWDDDEWFWR